VPKPLPLELLEELAERIVGAEVGHGELVGQSVLEYGWRPVLWFTSMEMTAGMTVSTRSAKPSAGARLNTVSAVAGTLGGSIGTSADCRARQQAGQGKRHHRLAAQLAASVADLFKGIRSVDHALTPGCRNE
jgi:hypothetical protein